ncbi:hypothetical protein [Mucilaginibacter sp. UR6-11]|uniref:hypothetical protein n=1 Tax=Mucilaginibacter sp. UR6-11 TaxID=1435644 RepID=UPI001E50DD6C|nr:hypothetical protein [Mucilaginibacter sp. UR6-11]MCC8425190.1 hypothetical protein [Mucilaginibacter sp. UR6-11]
MKSLYTFFFLLFCSTGLYAQFKLSGKISHYTGREQLLINIPIAYGYDEENNIHIPVAKNGAFTITIPVKRAKFASLNFQRTFHWLLLNPGKNLTVALDENDKKISFVSGTAQTENALLDNINLEEYPVFLQDERLYSNPDYATMNARVVRPYFAQRDSKIARVNQAPVSPQDKKQIIAEIKYNTLNNFYELVNLASTGRATVGRVITGLFSQTSTKPEVFPAGPQYYTFANNYLGYMERKAVAQAKSQNLKHNQLIPYYGITPDSLDAILTKYGEPYLRFIGATKFLPDGVTEQLTYRQIIHSFNDKNRVQIEILAAAFIKKFPASVYNADIRKKVNLLKNK